MPASPTATHVPPPVAGASQSANFPMFPDVPLGFYRGGYADAVVFRLSRDLSTLEGAAFVGGDDDDQAHAILLHGGHVYLAGHTDSYDFPVTEGAFQTYTLDEGRHDGFVCRLDPTLMQLEDCTLLGGEWSDSATALAPAVGGGIFVAGDTRSDDFPTAEVAWSHQIAGVHDAFVVRLDDSLSELWAGTFFGGEFSENVSDLVVTATDVLICGETSSSELPITDYAYDFMKGRDTDGYIARFDVTLENLLASTYLGGEDAEYPEDEITGMVLDDGGVVVCGTTACTDFPTTEGAFDETPNMGSYDLEDSFVTRLDRGLTTVLESTVLGGTEGDQAFDIALKPGGGLVVAGMTHSSDFPLQEGSWDSTLDGYTDIYIAWLSSDLSVLEESSLIGGTNGDGPHGLAVTGTTAYLTGDTNSTDFPTTQGAFDETYNTDQNRYDAFVAAFDLEPGVIEIDSYFLPKRVDVIVNQRKPHKSFINTGGWFDTGPDPADFALPCKLTIGTSTFDIPGLTPWRNSWWRYQGDGVEFIIKPSRVESSKAKFKLKFTGEPVAAIPRDGPLTLRYENGDIDAVGRVVLRKGRYKLNAVRGDLLAPPLALYSCRSELKGEGRDGVRTRFGLSTGQGAPDTAPDLTVGVGAMEETVPGASFGRKGEKYVYFGKKPGVTLAQLNYGKEKLAFHCAGVSLGPIPEGSQRMSISVRLGDQELILNVRMVRKGKLMLY